ncbi:SIMPL domain-containing protein [Fusobacterium sp. MFO224]|uniref:SIMPL domain-containing protein n=1 Tax=Fusobacterium sp. MFO224 TaxID=3378070 RepID=UPI003851D88A
MKKLISILMLVFSSFIFASSDANSASMMRTLKVTGTAYISAPVDMVVIHISNKDTKRTYEEAFEASKNALIKFKHELLSKGFKEKDLKTVDFNINTKYENYKDENGNYKKRFLGYQYSHNMKLNLKLDNSKLTKVLNSLKTIKGQSEFYLSYKIENTDKIKHKLLEKAVENAKNNSKIIASASDVDLKKIISIDYSSSQINSSVSPFRGELKIMGTNLNSDSILDINPENLKFEDTVTISWEIN